MVSYLTRRLDDSSSENIFVCLSLFLVEHVLNMFVVAIKTQKQLQETYDLCRITRVGSCSNSSSAENSEK